MDNKSIDIKQINEIAPQMQGHFISQYVRDHIDRMSAMEISKIILKHYHVFNLQPIKDAFYEAALDLGIKCYRDKRNLEVTAAFLKAKEFDDETIAEVIKRIGKYIRHAEANLIELYFKEYFTSILTLAFLYSVMVLFFRGSVEYYEYDLLLYLATIVLSSIFFLFTWYTKRKTSRRILGL